VFICASLGGISGMNLFKGFGGDFYDYYEPQLDTGRIYRSPDQFFLEAVK
jgi:Uma2 family endonuclease